jgi:hypothetical protein
VPPSLGKNPVTWMPLQFAWPLPPLTGHETVIVVALPLAPTTLIVTEALVAPDGTDSTPEAILKPPLVGTN